MTVLLLVVVPMLVVGARGRLDRLGSGAGFSAVRTWLPLGAACLVLGLGLFLTAQAISAPPTL